MFVVLALVSCRVVLWLLVTADYRVCDHEVGILASSWGCEGLFMEGVVENCCIPSEDDIWTGSTTLLVVVILADQHW